MSWGPWRDVLAQTIEGLVCWEISWGNAGKRACPDDNRLTLCREESWVDVDDVLAQTLERTWKQVAYCWLVLQELPWELPADQGSQSDSDYCSFHMASKPALSSAMALFEELLVISPSRCMLRSCAFEFCKFQLSWAGAKNISTILAFLLSSLGA